MQDIPHKSGDMAKLLDIADEARGRAQDPLQTPQPHSREASVECTAKIKTRDDKRMDSLIVVALVVREREKTSV